MNGIKSTARAYAYNRTYKPKIITLKDKASNLVHYLFDISFDFFK